MAVEKINSVCILFYGLHLYIPAHTPQRCCIMQQCHLHIFCMCLRIILFVDMFYCVLQVLYPLVLLFAAGKEEKWLRLLCFFCWKGGWKDQLANQRGGLWWKKWGLERWRHTSRRDGKGGGEGEEDESISCPVCQLENSWCLLQNYFLAPQRRDRWVGVAEEGVSTIWIVTSSIQTLGSEQLLWTFNFVKLPWNLIKCLLEHADLETWRFMDRFRDWWSVWNYFCSCQMVLSIALLQSDRCPFILDYDLKWMDLEAHLIII